MQLAQFVSIWFSIECQILVASASIHNSHASFDFEEFLQIADNRQRREATFSNDYGYGKPTSATGNMIMAPFTSYLPLSAPPMPSMSSMAFTSQPIGNDNDNIAPVPSHSSQPQSPEFELQTHYKRTFCTSNSNIAEECEHFKCAQLVRTLRALFRSKLC